MRLLLRLVSLATMSVTLGACAGRLAAAEDAFEEARYPDALRELRKLRDRGTWSAEEHARYALYRGLTHLSLGDARPASLWLGRAHAALEHDAGVFDDGERGRLLSAWRAMGRMPGERARSR